MSSPTDTPFIIVISLQHFVLPANNIFVVDLIINFLLIQFNFTCKVVSDILIYNGAGKKLTGKCWQN